MYYKTETELLCVLSFFDKKKKKERENLVKQKQPEMTAAQIPVAKQLL